MIMDKINNQKGVVLISVMLTLVLIGALAAFFIGIMISEFRISTSNRSGIVSFYVAESGIQEAIFRVKNDPIIREYFDNGTIDYTFSRSPFILANTSYTVTILAVVPGEAEIIATGKYQSGFFNSQRIVKIRIVTGIAQPPDWQNALYGARNVDISGSRIRVDGDIYAARGVNIWSRSQVNILGDVYAMSDIRVWGSSSLNVSGEKRANNFPPPPAITIEMPMIDFDSTDQSSLYNQATQIYTQQQFSNLLSSRPNLTLNGIIYVTGNIDIKETRVTVNGALIADGNVKIGMVSPKRGEPNPSLTVISPGEGQISGLLAKSKIEIGVHAKSIYIDGLVYSLAETKFFNFSDTAIINGGIIGGEIAITNCAGANLKINYNPDYIRSLIEINQASPPVEIEHWEESY